MLRHPLNRHALLFSGSNFVIVVFPDHTHYFRSKIKCGHLSMSFFVCKVKKKKQISGIIEIKYHTWPRIQYGKVTTKQHIQGSINFVQLCSYFILILSNRHCWLDCSRVQI